MPPFFTIITAARNAASTLPRLLDSLAGQTCRDFEFIIQDGASGDATLPLAESYRDRLPALSIASGPDAGIYDAWNKALPRVSGRWALFLGADDALAGPEVLAQARQALEQAGPEVLYAAGGVTLLTGWGEYYGEFPADANNAVKRLRRDMIFCHTGVFHNSVLFREHRFDQGYYSLGDYEFFCRTLRRDEQIITLDHTITRMALGGVSTRLCSQPRIFRASARVALKHYGALSPHHLKIGCIAAVIAPLCLLLGPDRAARFMDAVRVRRGKRPFWHQPPYKPGPAAIPPLPRGDTSGEDAGRGSDASHDGNARHGKALEHDENAAHARPLVSVITVCRNAEGTIGRTLRSLEAQAYPNLEYIVVDGASTDDTLEAVRQSPAVTRWISEPDKGIADAFNKGVSLARGEWIGILNADDWYERDAIATAMAAPDQADLIHGAVRYWDGDAPREVYHPRQDRLHLEMTINHPSVFVRRSLYERLGGFDPAYRYAMDYELILRFLAAGARFVQLEAVLANMSYGGASDAHWRGAALECARAKSAHLGSPLTAGAYCGWQIARGGARRALEKLGLRGLIRAFRKRFSVVPKS